MLPDALKKVRGRGRYERKVEEEKGDSKWREQNALKKMLMISYMTPKLKQGMCAATGSGEYKSTMYSCCSKFLLWKANLSCT